MEHSPQAGPTKPRPAGMHRALGGTGLSVFPIGLGTVTLGRTAGLKLAAPPSHLPSDAEVSRVLEAAAEIGVNLIDTAPAYGESESRLGRLLWRVRPRDHWVICTKAGEHFDEATGRSSYDFSARAIRQSVEESLARLGTDRLDIVLLHFSGSTDDAEILRQGEALGSLRDLQAAGKARAVGASVGTLAGGREAISRGCDVLMVTLSPAEPAQRSVAVEAAAQGRGVLAKKALAGGRLGAGESLRWVLADGSVACAVVGTRSGAHLRENAQAAGLA